MTGMTTGTGSVATGEPALVAAELFIGPAWDKTGDLLHARFVALPRVGDTIELPQRDGALFRVIEVRHRSATPAGGTARVQLLARPSGQAGHVRDSD